MKEESSYSYHVATELGGLFRQFSELPCIHQSMCAVMFSTHFHFSPFSIQLIANSVSLLYHENFHHVHGY